MAPVALIVVVLMVVVVFMVAVVLMIAVAMMVAVINNASNCHSLGNGEGCVPYL